MLFRAAFHEKVSISFFFLAVRVPFLGVDNTGAIIILYKRERKYVTRPPSS